MTQDSNTLVREASVEDLAFLYQVNKVKAISIARKVLNDNERVRRRMACMFLPYLFAVERETCLEVCCEIVNIQNISSIERDDTLRCAIDIICVGALRYDSSSYASVLDKLVADPTLKSKVKESIDFSCSKDEFTSNESTAMKLIRIYHELLLNSPISSRHQIGSRLLYGLVKNGLSLFPQIDPLLETLSKEQYPQNSYHVTIIDYLSKFGLNFPEQAAKYLKNITDGNSHLFTSPLYPQRIFTTVKGLLVTSLPQNWKNNLIRILEKMTESNYINLNLPEIKDFLQGFKNGTIRKQ
jgi:hypothetical protein